MAHFLESRSRIDGSTGLNMRLGHVCALLKVERFSAGLDFHIAIAQPGIAHHQRFLRIDIHVLEGDVRQWRFGQAGYQTCSRDACRLQILDRDVADEWRRRRDLLSRVIASVIFG